ncbi:MAG: hypothetical protein ACKVS8_06155 [Phycisphaerales bacterium]
MPMVAVGATGGVAEGRCAVGTLSMRMNGRTATSGVGYAVWLRGVGRLGTSASACVPVIAPSTVR